MTKISNRDFKGIWIPSLIWCHPDLSPLERVLLAEIDSLDRPKTHCVASNLYFANFFNVTERHIARCIAKLKDKGLISWHFNGRRRNLQSKFKMALQAKAANGTYPHGGHLCQGSTDKNVTPALTLKSGQPGQKCHPFDGSNKVDRIVDKKDYNQNRMFETFWELYPKKSNKLLTMESFTEALQIDSFQNIIAGLREQLNDFLNLAADDKTKFIPNPKNWLDQQRWTDRPLKRGAGFQNRQEIFQWFDTKVNETKKDIPQ